MSKVIVVTIEVEVPDEATDEQIHDFVCAQFGECGGMKLDNPCRINYDVIDTHWEDVVDL